MTSCPLNTSLSFRLKLFDGIISAGVEGMTPQKPHHAEKKASEWTVLPDRTDRIFGACRVKSATGNKKGGYAHLVKSDKYDKDLFQNLYQHVIQHLIFLLREFPIPGIHPDRPVYVHLFWQ
jgi:hypothetical protein